MHSTIEVRIVEHAPRQWEAEVLDGHTVLARVVGAVSREEALRLVLKLAVREYENTDTELL